MKLRLIIWVGLVVCIRKISKNTNLVGKCQGKETLRRPRHK
jgi:hypothetical protein